MEIAGIKISIVSLDDLVRMKALSGRRRDQEDINHLERVKTLRNSKRGGNEY